MKALLKGRVSGISQDEEGQVTTFVSIKPNPEKAPGTIVVIPLIGVQVEMNTPVKVFITDEQ